VTAEASYKYRHQTSVPWIEKYQSISTLGEDEIARVKAQKATDEALFRNMDAIDAIIKALSDGPLNQGDVIKAVDAISAIGRRVTIRVLEHHSGTKNQYGQFWVGRKSDKNSTEYSLNHAAESSWNAKKMRLGGGV
jgi:hypothetical protein